MFTLSIKTDNAAFKDESGDDYATANEVARILRAVADAVEHGDTDGRTRDGNGNTVGSWELTSDDEEQGQHQQGQPELYDVVRYFQREEEPTQVLKRGVTLAEAQAHCNDPEMSSKTCTGIRGRNRTKSKGQWFDGYRKAAR